MDLIEKIRKRIPLLQDCVKIEVITKGFSSDVKYIVHNSNEEKYLLRTANMTQFSRKKEEYAILAELYKEKVNSPKPIEIGRLTDLEICYYLLSYIEGEDARDLLPLHNHEVQFEIGRKAGEDLRKINCIHAPSTIAPWYERKVNKYRDYLETYKICGIEIKGDQKVVEFIERNINALKNRPNRFLHDDFHVGNLIVHDAKYAGVIDFNRFDWGDPYLEFLKIGLFSREISVPFSNGQIHGYFKNNIPDNFWQLYSLYLAMELFSAVVWTQKVVPEKLVEMLERIEMILEDHKGFKLYTPTWYND